MAYDTIDVAYNTIDMAYDTIDMAYNTIVHTPLRTLSSGTTLGISPFPSDQTSIV